MPQFDFFGHNINTDLWTGNWADAGTDRTNAPSDQKSTDPGGANNGPYDRVDYGQPPGHTQEWYDRYQEDPYHDPLQRMAFGGIFSPQDQAATRSNQAKRDQILNQLQSGMITPEAAYAESQGLISLDEAKGYYTDPFKGTGFTPSQPGNAEAVRNELSVKKRDAALSSLDEMMKHVHGTTEAFQGDIDKFTDKWESKLKDFENLTADAALGDIQGLDASFDQAAMKLDMLKDQGVPADQIAGKKLQLELQKADVKGQAVRQYRVAHNNTVAQINTQLTQSYGQLLSQLGSIRQNENMTEAQIEQARGQIESGFYDELKLSRLYTEQVVFQAGQGAMQPVNPVGGRSM